MPLPARQPLSAAAFAIFLSLFPAIAPACAADMAPPQGEVVLSVTGAIGCTNDGAAARLDRALLESLPQRTFRTTTIWTDGVQEFTGVALADLLRSLDASGKTVIARAINDYQIDIPVDEVSEEAPIIAYRMNGAPMSIRDKGPLWIVYPFDDNPRFQSEVAYARSVWQLAQIEVTD